MRGNKTPEDADSGWWHEGRFGKRSPGYICPDCGTDFMMQRDLRKHRQSGCEFA